MPQLIAMIIIVVGAMIYMFQTFGGTGDKITGVAQKTSVITEINNIKSGLQFAARDGVIYEISPDVVASNKVGTLQGLAQLNYFANQINEQLKQKKDGTARGENDSHNVYSAISFGGNSANADDGDGAMLISLVTKEKYVPGIFVDLSKGGLKDNKAFLESSLAKDLEGLAYIDRKAVSADAGGTALVAADAGTSFIGKASKTEGGAGTDSDGMFIIYFKDFSSSELVKKD